MSKRNKYDYTNFTTNVGRFNNQQWHVYNHGKTSVFVESGGFLDGAVREVHKGRGGVLREKEARDFVENAKWYHDFEAWSVARREAISRWKHETPHYRYDADAGSIALRISTGCKRAYSPTMTVETDGAHPLVMKVSNLYGDGNKPVYVVNNYMDIPSFFDDAGVSVSEGAVVEVLPYDCEPYHIGEGPLVPLARFVVGKGGLTVGRYQGAVAISIGGGEILPVVSER